MRRRYDLAILGGGTAGIFAGLTAAGLGARVALVEEGRLGGECLNTGCVPSKTLIATATLVQRMREAERFGLEAVEPDVDLGRVMDRVRAAIAEAGKRDTPEHLAAQGVTVIPARGRFAGPGRIDADGRTLSWRAALIGTGSRPAVPAIPGLDGAGALTNETVFDLRELPRRLAVLGGGAIGCELGQAFARLGSDVTIVEAEPRLLPHAEPEASALVAEVLAGEGVSLRTGAAAERLEPDSRPGAGKLVVSEGDPVQFDRLLIATGRRPATDDLGLESVGVRLNGGGGVDVDRFLRTSGDRIYAAGDSLGDLHYTHVAAYQALVVVANSLFRARRAFEREWMPAVTFTDPEIARVGLTEAEARARLGREPIVLRHDYAELDRAITAAARGFSKLVTDRRGRMLGATIAGPSAGDAIAEVARLVREGRKAQDLSQMVHAYPTFAEGPARAADEWWRRRYFTPGARRVFRPVLAALRWLDRPRGR